MKIAIETVKTGGAAELKADAREALAGAVAQLETAAGALGSLSLKPEILERESACTALDDAQERIARLKREIADLGFLLRTSV